MKSVKRFKVIVTKIISALKKKNYAEFEQSIYQFENVFNATLQVVSKQAILFLIFIKSLYQIHEELLQWQEQYHLSQFKLI